MNQLPFGVKDYISKEMEKKAYIETTLKNVFFGYGYQLIETPTFELHDLKDDTNNLYNLINRQGEILALRSDMTKSIARVVSTTTKDFLYPQRYCYLTNIFRYPKEYLGMLHEFSQAGIEMIGRDSINADAEAILVAINALISLKLNDFSFHLGSMEVLEIALETLNEKLKEEVYNAIISKDVVTLKKILKDSSSFETLRLLTESVGQVDLLYQAINKTQNEKMKNALSKLKAIYDILDEQGLSKYIYFDFSILSYAKYYTGIYFQVYTKGIGNAICEGGRYNSLIAQFGNNQPAVGFGININDLMKKDLDIPKIKKVLDTKKIPNVCTYLYDNESLEQLFNYGLFYEIDEINYQNKKYLLKEGKYHLWQ